MIEIESKLSRKKMLVWYSTMVKTLMISRAILVNIALIKNEKLKVLKRHMLARKIQ